MIVKFFDAAKPYFDATVKFIKNNPKSALSIAISAAVILIIIF